MKLDKIVVVVFSALLIVVFMPLFSSTADSDPGEISVTKGETTNFGGGSYVEVRHGNAGVGVLYGTSARPNHIIIYSFGETNFGEIDSFDGSRLVRKETANVKTLITEEITRIIEFRDINNNSRFDSFVGKDGKYNLTGLDYPVRGIELNGASEAFPKITEVSDNEVSVSFKLVLRNPKENLHWNDIKGEMLGVHGGKIAYRISIDFQINFTYREESVTQAHYLSSGSSSLKYDGKISRDAIASDISVGYSYKISGWDFKYDNSKLFIETKSGVFSGKEGCGLLEKGIYANITTSNPRYLELNGSEKLGRTVPIYGHGFRIFMENKKIGTFTGDRHSVVDGTNRSYLSVLAGQYPENMTFLGESYGGFVLDSTEAYRQGNMSNAKSISLTYVTVSPFVPTDAVPPWSNILPFEAASVVFLGLYISRKRSG